MISKLHKTINSAAIIVAIALTIVGLPALAAGEHGSGHTGKRKIGGPADPDLATRTIRVTMRDNTYEPKAVTVEHDETVRFIITNAGEFVHEFAIATAEMHEAHRPQMLRMMEAGVLEADKINWPKVDQTPSSRGQGAHKETNSLLLEPGKSGEIIWTFPKSGNLEFACNVPGHYESGMVGKIHLGR